MHPRFTDCLRQLSNDHDIHFVLAVGTGLTFTLLSVHLMGNILTFPIILIPFFGVPITGASSVIAIDSLLKRSKSFPKLVADI